MQRSNSELGIISPSTSEFTITNKGDALSPTSFAGGTVWIDLAMTDDITDRAHVVRRWRFRIIGADGNYESITFKCEDYFQEFLEGDWPNTFRYIRYLMMMGEVLTATTYLGLTSLT